MSVYCLHEWNFKYDFGWVTLCSMVLFGTAFYQKGETVEQPNETSRQLPGKALPTKQQ